MVPYAFLHAMGTVFATPKFGPESDAVASTMKAVHVVAQGADCTWYGWFRGFGVLVTLFMILSAAFAWRLAGAAAAQRRSFAPVTWTLILSWAVASAIAWVYFFPVPVAFSCVITGLLLFGCLRDGRRGGDLSSKQLVTG
jgi:hypothetical protein